MSTVQSSRVLSTVGTPQKKMFHGIYEASVVNNNDPLGLGRVQMYVPQVLGLAVSNWAVPLGFSTQDNAPAVNTIVHAYFTGGDVNHPVYAFTTNVETAINTGISSVQPGAWTAMSLQNGWANTSGYIGACYRMINNSSEVEVIGNISVPESGFVEQFFQLPVAPAHIHSFPCFYTGAFEIETVGDVTEGFLYSGLVSGSSLENTAVQSQESETPVDYVGGCVSIDTSGNMTAIVNGLSTNISFHETIPLTL
jgi:hypothetical protein